MIARPRFDCAAKSEILHIVAADCKQNVHNYSHGNHLSTLDASTQTDSFIFHPDMKRFLLHPGHFGWVNQPVCRPFTQFCATPGSDQNSTSCQTTMLPPKMTTSQKMMTNTCNNKTANAARQFSFVVRTEAESSEGSKEQLSYDSYKHVQKTWAADLAVNCTSLDLEANSGGAPCVHGAQVILD